MRCCTCATTHERCVFFRLPCAHAFYIVVGMKMLLFGGSGRVGQVVRCEAQKEGWQVAAPGREECDLRSPAAVSACVLSSGAEAVVNCAAVAGLEACLDDPLTAHLVNAVAPAEMALACRHTGARFVHLSTDYVLDGRRPGKRDESSKCKPINTYGESKREGELEVAENGEGALILRVSWVCGNPARPSFVESIVARARRGESLAAIDDKYSLPTHAADIARGILALLPRRESGVLHLCSTGAPMSWHACAELALQAAVEQGALPCMPSVARQKMGSISFFRDPRPLHTAMDNSRLLSLGISMPSAEATLRRAVQEYLSSAPCA